jgi:hypothetical protein
VADTGGLWQTLAEFGGFRPKSHFLIFLLMIKMLNLFKLKDGQRPRLDDVSIEKHLPLRGEL